MGIAAIAESVLLCAWGEGAVLRSKCLRCEECVNVQVVPELRKVQRGGGLEESAVQVQQALRSPEVSLELPVECKCLRWKERGECASGASAEGGAS